MADLGEYFRSVKLVQERYPQAANWLAKHPDLLNIYIQAVREDWPQERLQASLSNTAYYKTTTDKERAFDVLLASNPREADKIRDQFAVKLVDYVTQVNGTSLSQQQLVFAATAAARQGMSDEELHDYVIGLAARDPNALNNPGEFGATMTKVRKVADEYAVPMDDASVLGWARDMLSGQSRGGRRNEDALRDQLTKQAQSLYPQLKEELAAGRTVADWAQPYKAVAAQELGVAADTITFNDPKWQKMLQGIQADPNTPLGISSRPMTLAEWQAKIRTDAQYGFDKTNNGRQAAAGIAQEMAKMFGNVG